MSTIYIASNGGKLHKKDETLQLRMHDGTVSTIFPFRINNLIITGKVDITGGALQLLMKHNLDTLFLGKNGRFNGQLVFQESRNVFLRQKQFQLLEKNQIRVEFAKEIVTGKLHNQLIFMQRIARKNNKNNNLSTAIRTVKTNITKVKDTESLQSLRGLEGSGAKAFFSVMRMNIIPDFAVFNGRSMHPPKDNVNAVLSFIYTLLFFRISSALEQEGLDPYVGYFHELNYGKKTLAFDLMEEYRTPIADTLCCALFNLGILKEDDFEGKTFSTDNPEYPLQEEKGDNSETGVISEYKESKGILLTKEGIKKVITQFEKKMETRITYLSQNRNISYKKVMQEQIKMFKRFINGEGSVYKPITTK